LPRLVAGQHENRAFRQLYLLSLFQQSPSAGRQHVTKRTAFPKESYAKLLKITPKVMWV